ncbi:hypothetical protein [Mucilaginibacter psychrotolerans]|uniref:Uncharacterized protein n=1 Tax=Mucilaginibacter psychrotolerans TaxID=1524096 RepID=A0A4Y8SAF9_9SPHI|nr:hypothetical protein [Mucilaginibacter psychrotolerans]TFF35376.1 hypothetical protein E2R66_19155 [Mucilaginibacter psychrotolerans]
MDAPIIGMFLKFGSEENIRDLYENGTIYLNTIQYFRRVEDNQLRGDSYEGISRIKNYPPGTFEIPSLKFKGNYLNIHLRESHEEVLGNIFSLYCISSFTINNPLTFEMDSRVLGFGSHCLMIKDNLAFLRKIEHGLKGIGLEFSHGFVKYYDKNKINGRINLFQKPLEFSYQKEFRFYVQSDIFEPLMIKIGSLESISEVVSTSDILSLKLVAGK